MPTVTNVYQFSRHLSSNSLNSLFTMSSKVLVKITKKTFHALNLFGIIGEGVGNHLPLFSSHPRLHHSHPRYVLLFLLLLFVS